MRQYVRRHRRHLNRAGRHGTLLRVAAVSPPVGRGARMATHCRIARCGGRRTGGAGRMWVLPHTAPGRLTRRGHRPPPGGRGRRTVILPWWPGLVCPEPARSAEPHAGNYAANAAPGGQDERSTQASDPSRRLNRTRVLTTDDSTPRPRQKRNHRDTGPDRPEPAARTDADQARNRPGAGETRPDTTDATRHRHRRGHRPGPTLPGVVPPGTGGGPGSATPARRAPGRACFTTRSYGLHLRFPVHGDRLASLHSVDQQVPKQVTRSSDPSR